MGILAHECIYSDEIHCAAMQQHTSSGLEKQAQAHVVQSAGMTSTSRQSDHAPLLIVL